MGGKPFPVVMYFIPAALLIMAIVNSFFGVKPEPAQALSATVQNVSVIVPPAPDLPELKNVADQVFASFVDNSDRRQLSLKLKPGGTLAVLLDDAGVGRVEAAYVIQAISKLFNPRSFRAGQQLKLVLEPRGDNKSAMHLVSLATRIDAERTILVRRDENGSFHSRELLRETSPELVRVQGAISGSLYLSALEAGASDAAILEFSRLYAYSVDFQRGIRAGDSFDMVFERLVDEQGRMVRTGNLLYARLMPRKRDLKLYRYQTPDGEVGYYNEKGESARRFLMKTPVEGARISSSFGRRKHPVLGYTRAHKGTDFAAVTGTPILAAGNGVIERSSRFGSYGNYVRIRHSNGFKTAYAHMSKFGRGIKKGRRVQQGQIIGYVGATGRVTGPHLHYEVLKKGRHVNPMTVKLPTGRKLKRSELAAFAQEVGRIDDLLLRIGAEQSQLADAKTKEKTTES